jgi:REP element-mobilizing transposase RayT
MPRNKASLRLPGFDYASLGAYFVTICAYRSQTLFDDVAIQLVIDSAWRAIPAHFPHVETDAFVICPTTSTASSCSSTTLPLL